MNTHLRISTQEAEIMGITELKRNKSNPTEELPTQKHVLDDLSQLILDDLRNSYINFEDMTQEQHEPCGCPPR